MLKCLRPRRVLAPGVNVICTTRAGGVSENVFASLNLGLHVGDQEEHVNENRRRLMQALNLPAEPSWLNQVHGVEIVEASLNDGLPIEADGAYSNRAGRVCAVMTADCMPIVLCDDRGTKVMAIHAGWRGIAADIVERAVDEFSVDPQRLSVWLGPAISVDHFEIGAELLEQLGGPEQAYRESDQSDKYYACLNTLVRHRLRTLGVTNVQGGEHCTYANQRDFFSYRRDGQCGRMATLIWRLDEK